MAPDPPAIARGRAGVSEEDTAARSTPAHNLLGAGVMATLGLAGLVFALLLPDPDGRIVTAPGLLPALVAGSLVLMAAALAVGGVRGGAIAQLRGWAQARGGDAAAAAENRRVGLLAAGIAAYIAIVDHVFFDWTLVVGATRLSWGSFELVTTVFLTVVLRAFWRARAWRCGLVALVFATALTAIFRYGFHIPVPGSG